MKNILQSPEDVSGNALKMSYIPSDMVLIIGSSSRTFSNLKMKLELKVKLPFPTVVESGSGIIFNVLGLLSLQLHIVIMVIMIISKDNDIRFIGMILIDKMQN